MGKYLVAKIRKDDEEGQTLVEYALMSNPVCNRCGESILPIRKVNLSIRSPKDLYKVEYDVCEVCFEIALIFMNGNLLENEERIKSAIKKSFEEENIEKTLEDEIKDLDNVQNDGQTLVEYILTASVIAIMLIVSLNSLSATSVFNFAQSVALLP